MPQVLERPSARAALPPAPAPRATKLLVLGLFLFSGASGLIYEVAWSRMFSLVLGTTVYSVATVLGVFMGGLALGSWLFGGVADRGRISGLRLYAWLELGIGAFAVALPPLMRLSDSIYRAAWPAVEGSFEGLMLVRLGLACAILIVPSVLMGGTLPVLSRYLVHSRERIGLEIGTLYAINTLGAVAGCFIAGFFLLEHLGVRLTLYTAAVLNFIVGAVAFAWSRGDATGSGREPAEEPRPSRGGHADRGIADEVTLWQSRLALGLYACSGFAALALEVLWTRSLLYFTSVDTWAFTSMLSAFLAGIGFGSLAMARFAPRIRRPLLWLAVIELLIGLSAAASIPLFERLHGTFESVAAAVPAGGLLSKIATKLAVSFVVMLAPTLLMGAAFPLVSAIYVGTRRAVGRGVGTLYALNTVGAIAGSTAAGFLIIPALGLQNGILLCSSVFLVIGLALLAALPMRRASRGVVWATCAAALAATAWTNVAFEGRPLILQSAFFKDPQRPHKLVYSHEGSAASLTVVENAVGTKLLNINGITTAINNYMDMQVHRMLSHLPMLMHPDPREVLVVGFGMGSTPWGCCQHPEVQRVDVVELLRMEKQTAPIFADINHNVIDHPKLRFIEGDGRNFLLGTRNAYDVISFNAIHPRFSPYLYTFDFYKLCRERLADDGVICAWLTQNAMTEDEFRMLCRSFTDVFEHSTLWYCNPEHFCLVGTMTPTRIDLDDLARRMAVPAVQADLADSNLAQPPVLASRLLIGGAALSDYVAGAPLNTDDLARIEFARETKEFERPIIERLIDLSRRAPPRGFFAGSEEAMREVARHQQAFDLLAAGQIEHWYPRAGPPARELAWRRALLITPENQDVRHNLGFSDLVIRQIEEELARRPENLAALTRRGMVMTELGRLDEAEAALVQALRYNPGLVPAAEQLAFVYLLSGRPGESANWLQGLLNKAKPDDPRLLYGLSVALEESGRTGEATAPRVAALNANPAWAEWFDLFRRSVETVKSLDERRRGGP